MPVSEVGVAHLLREAPRARMMGSVISIMDCRVEVTTMKRMMLRRKVRCRVCMSNRPVWRARRSRVTPSVTPLIQNKHIAEGPVMEGLLKQREDICLLKST